MPVLQRKIIIIFLLLCVSMIAVAQQKTVKHGNQQWVQYYGQAKLGEKFTLQADGGYRAADGFKTSVQYIARAGMAYSITPQIQVAAGFANLGFYASGKINKREFRPYEELLIKNTFKRFQITHRYRIEERFFNLVSDGKIERPGTFNFRFRYLMMAAIPLFKLSKSNNNAQFLLNIGDEIFFNAGEKIVYNVFDQNRLIISPTLQCNKNFSISFTWNNQFASANSPATYNHTNVLWLQVRQTLNFVRKKE
jgi:hypothetical protein